MGECEEDHILHGPPFEYVAEYTSVGKLIFDCLQEDPTFIGQIEAHTGHKYTFSEILDRSVRLALWLQDVGVGPGDVVSYITVNHRDMIIVVYGTLFVGATLTPWDTLLTAQDITHFMDHTKPKVVICSKDVTNSVKTAAEELRVTPVFVVHGESSGFISFENTLIHSETKIGNFQCVNVEENDVALLVCTSGTSALPKILERTHKSLLMASQNVKKRSILSSPNMTFAPLCWVSGLQSVIQGPISKLQRVVAPYFDAELTGQWIEQYQVHFLILNPPMLVRMIKSCDAISKYDLSSLRVVVVGGGTLRAWHCEKFAKFAPISCKILLLYGVTEMNGSISINVHANNPAGSCGKLLSGVSGKIINPRTGETISPYEPGELCVRHPTMFSGYYNDPVQTKAAIDSEGWFHTGDLAKFNKQEELFVIDRLKDIINVNDVGVSPAELEAILTRHPEVRHVGVVGKRVSSDVEHPVAFVAKTLGSNVTEAELCDFFKEECADDAKQLRGGVRFLPEIPRSTSGKIKRWELRKMLELET